MFRRRSKDDQSPLEMAEPRRVQLTTLSSAVDLTVTPPSPAVPQRAPELPADEKAADTGTVRLVLMLFEADEQAFPEFSYSQLISNQGGKSKKRDRIQDLIDIGYGYDDEDSFIDNSEAYDEFVPASIITRLGGFYVNSGVLQFHNVCETETDEATEEKSHERPKRRKLNRGLDKPKKKHNDDTKVEANVRPSSETVGKNGQKNGQKKMNTLSVTGMLKKFQREKECDRQRLEQGRRSLRVPPLGRSPLAIGPADAAGGGYMGPLLNLIVSTNEQVLIPAAGSVDSDLDSLLDVSKDSSSSRFLPQLSTEVPLQNKVEEINPLTAPLQTKAKETLPYSAPLQQTAQSATSPDSFPPALEESIQKLMMATKTSEGESKVKFYTSEINAILLKIELQCRQHSGPLRSRVYSHLSTFLPCNKDTLLRRVNKLMHTYAEEPLEVDNLMKALKDAIGKAMPAQIMSWQQTCEAHDQGKITNTAHVVGATEEDTEEKGVKKGRGPKKLFKWNKEISECLCNVLRVKMEQYTQEKESQDLEKYLKTMLDNEVKPLWSKGWMPSRILLKESRKLLGLSASGQVKKTASAPNAGQLSGSAADPEPPPDSPLEFLADQAMAHHPRSLSSSWLQP